MMEELKDFIEEELQFNIKQLGNCFEQDELLNIGATVYTLNTILNKLNSLEGEEL